MKILMINKFLHPNGGSETYIFKLSKQLEAMGHEVQFFGMEHEGRIVGNRVNAYTSDMDFHGGSMLSKITYPIKTVYSFEARKKLRKVLKDFKPDACHINNFNFQLTPSIILEIVSWRKKNGVKCPIVYTAHDYQLVCPNHMCNDPVTGENCEKCLGAGFMPCVKGRCIHGSLAKSAVGAVEGALWRKLQVYRHFDSIICCSAFMKSRLDSDPILAKNTTVMHNFVDKIEPMEVFKQDYVLYFGRLSAEKGTRTLLEAAKKLPDVRFKFAGTGPLEHEITGKNVEYVGFKTGMALEKLIREARFTVYPSEWYENCPFSVMESQLYLTPVVASDIGGIPEIVKNGVTGELFESGNAEALSRIIDRLWNDKALTDQYSRNCIDNGFLDVQAYAEKLLEIYAGK